MSDFSRRTFVKSLGAAAMLPAAIAAPALTVAASAGAATATAAPDTPFYLFFNAEEVAFMEAACERLIPADENGPGALQAWVPNYFDKQLGGGWGAGERLYRSGPWQEGTPTQGYQLPFTPAELFRTAIRAINAEFSAQDKAFNALDADAQDAYLKTLQAGGKDLGGVPAGVFFELLLKMTVEGYFADPVYGGNKDMLAWRMIGFPGAYANYYEAIDAHGVAFVREPMSLAEDGHGHMHPANIPASL
ncbi:MAG: gluconate 2-dehydrogenase subunit 3 family protein [Dokdonella sp.]